jgi:cyclophilin family peptidyl-prolyl cis-trans isomerase
MRPNIQKMTLSRTLFSFALMGLIFPLISAAGCNNAGQASEVASEAVQPGGNPAGDVTAEQTGGTPRRVEITTDLGRMVVELSNETPQHRDNFVKLVESGFYDGLLFHRVIQGFMVQGGDPQSRDAAPGARLGAGGPGYTIPAEIRPNLFHTKGALSAARQGDNVNPQRASSGSQFYIVQGRPTPEAELRSTEARLRMSGGDFSYPPEAVAAYAQQGGTPHLDQQYTVFGHVVEGLEIIDAIAAAKTAPGDRPVEDIRMTMKMLN